MRMRWAGLLVVMLASGRGRAVAEPPATHPGVTLKSGRIIQGRPAGEVRVRGESLLRIETDYGQLLVPASEAVASEAGPVATAAESTYVARTIRLVKITGRAERRAHGAELWEPLTFTDAYGGRRSRDAVILAGDSVRTGVDGEVDLMLHRGAWVRLAADTEVEFPAGPAPASLSLLKGTTAHQVAGRPGGQVFRVAAANVVLGVRGTVFAVRAGGDGGVAGVLEGTVVADGQREVRAGEQARFGPAGRLEVTPLGAPLRRWLERPFLRYPDDDLVYVPTGTYRLGGQDPWDRDGSRRATSVRVDALLIDRLETSAGDIRLWLECTGRTLAHAAARPGPSAGGDSLPALYLTTGEVAEYARWREAEIPTEVQWEAAARGAQGLEHPWGNAPLGTTARVTLATYEREGYGALVASSLLAAVDAPSDDISPFGCANLATNAPELCLAMPLTEHAAAATPGTTGFAIRGRGNHIRGRVGVPEGGPHGAGFRLIAAP